MFLCAAIWNWILAVVFLTLPRIDMNYFTAVGFEIPNSMLWFDSFMGLIFVFGIGFYIVSTDITQNHGLILMACFEKTIVFIIPVMWFFLGEGSLWVVLVASGDLLFGLLFMEDLRAIRKLV